MVEPRSVDIAGNHNTVGDGNLINRSEQSVVVNFPMGLLQRYEVDEYVKLNSDPVQIAVLVLFVVFCIALVVAPFVLYEYSSRNPAMQDIQSLITTLTSTMSGFIGLLGVLVGYRVRDRRLTIVG